MIKLILPLVFFVATAKAQDSLKALGVMVFKAFKENKLDLLFENRLKESQVDSFFIWMGKDITTDNYKRYKSKYKSITQKFIVSCRTFEMDMKWHLGNTIMRHNGEHYYQLPQ